MILADKIIRLRKKNGWSQEELANQMNVSRQAVSKWEGAQTVPDLERILQLSALFGVSTDYLLKDEMENEEYIDTISDCGVRKVTLSEANEYLAKRKAASKHIALATFLCIIAIFPLLLLGAASENAAFIWSENVSATVGLIAMFLIIVPAVIIFIRTGFNNAPFEFIEKEPFETEYGVVGFVKEAKRKFRPLYARYNIIGTCMCILSPVPLFISAVTENEMFQVCMLTLTLLIAAIGTVFFITAGVQWASMEKLLKEGEYTAKAKEKSKVKETVGVVYWVAVTSVFLLVSFLNGDIFGSSGNEWSAWQYSWVIWPIAAVLFIGVMKICDFLTDKNSADK